MIIYIAAPYPCREEAQRWAKLLTEAGHLVTARWVTNEGEDSKDPNDQAYYAKIDMEDIESAYSLVLMTGYRGDRSWTGGRHWEAGYAYAKERRIIVVGPRESVFHHIPSVQQYDTIEEMIDAHK